MRAAGWATVRCAAPIKPQEFYLTGVQTPGVSSVLSIFLFPFEIALLSFTYVYKMSLYIYMMEIYLLA